MEDETTEPTTELVVRETHSKIVGGIPYFNEYMALAERICRTAMVPSALTGKPDATLAVMMYGAELGIGPMQACQQINFIGGKPSAAAELLRALVMSEGHQFIVTETPLVATVQARRKDWTEWRETTFTLEDAATAELCEIRDGRAYARSRDGKVLAWEKTPGAMLVARVTSKACRMWFADVISGMSYTPEEVESFSIATPARPETPATPEKSPHEVLYERLINEITDKDKRRAFVERVTGLVAPKFSDLLPDQVADLLYALDHENTPVEAEIVEAEVVETVTVDGKTYPRGQEPFEEGDF